MNKSLKSSLIASVLSLSVIVSTPAFGAPASIANGDFELGDNGATSIEGWTSVNERINLGVSEIAGCVTEDTSNYSILRDYLAYAVKELYSEEEIEDAEVDGEWYRFYNFLDENMDSVLIGGYRLGYAEDSDENYTIFLETDDTTTPRERLFEENWSSAQRQAVVALADPTVANDALADDWSQLNFNTGLRSNSESSAFEEDWQSFDESLAWDSQFVELYSDMNSDDASAQEDGYVVHGPAIYSDEFSAKTIDDLSFSYAASADGDDFKVFGYLLNTADCSQSEVLDTTGENQAWETVTAAIPADGDYRFVFVSGTYDQSWGGVAGATMFVDDAVLSPNAERAAEAAALAETGADFDWLLVAGLTSAAVGSGLVVASRRRRIS
jgi:LPXTG-motif cell wall-anchored protein